MQSCPVCKQPLSTIRVPTSFKQALWGGWTCPRCGSELDRRCKLIKKNEKGMKEYEAQLYKEEYVKEKARLQARKESKQRDK